MAFPDNGPISMTIISNELGIDPNDGGLAPGVRLSNPLAREASDNADVAKLPIAFSEFIGAAVGGSAKIGFNFIVGYESIAGSSGTSYRVGYIEDSWDIGSNPDTSNPPASTSAPIEGDVELSSEDGSVSKVFELYDFLPERFYEVGGSGGSQGGEWDGGFFPEVSDNYQFFRAGIRTKDRTYINNGKWEYQQCEIVLYSDPYGSKTELARQVCKQNDPEFDMNVGLLVGNVASSQAFFTFDLGRNESTNENGPAEAWYTALYNQRGREVRVEFNFS